MTIGEIDTCVSTGDFSGSGKDCVCNIPGVYAITAFASETSWLRVIRTKSPGPYDRSTIRIQGGTTTYFYLSLLEEDELSVNSSSAPEISLSLARIA